MSNFSMNSEPRRKQVAVTVRWKVVAENCCHENGHFGYSNVIDRPVDQPTTYVDGQNNVSEALEAPNTRLRVSNIENSADHIELCLQGSRLKSLPWLSA